MKHGGSRNQEEKFRLLTMVRIQRRTSREFYRESICTLRRHNSRREDKAAVSLCHSAEHVEPRIQPSSTLPSQRHGQTERKQEAVKRAPRLSEDVGDPFSKAAGALKREFALSWEEIGVDVNKERIVRSPKKSTREQDLLNTLT